MAFTPENKLEALMARAVADETARPEFYRLLMEWDLFVMGTITNSDPNRSLSTGVSMSLVTVRRDDGGDYHPVFSSEEQLIAFAGRGTEYFRMRGDVLFDNTRGAAFVLNPGADPSKTLVPQEIEWCLANYQQMAAAPSFVISLPKTPSKKLMKALCVLFASRSLVRSAHLAAVARDDGIDQPHPLIALVTEGNAQQLIQEVFAACGAALPGTRVDVVAIDPNSSLDDMQRNLLRIPPFYRRTAALH